MIRPALLFLGCLLGGMSPVVAAGADAPAPRALRLEWANRMLTISGDHIPGRAIKIHYLEAYCRPGSTDRDWRETVIPHRAKLVSASPDGQTITLHDALDDGVEVDHVIKVEQDAVDFRVTARNPTDKPSLAHWAQPCLRVDGFVGVKPVPSSEEYLPRGFIFLDGKLARLPTQPWATKARYVPGQVWCPRHVDRNDVNPRPLSTLVPSNGLIGCFSADERQVLAVAWEPYQELFQGVIVCLHSDFRIGGLAPGQTRSIRGKLYLTDADIPALLRRYQADFPEHAR